MTPSAYSAESGDAFMNASTSSAECTGPSFTSGTGSGSGSLKVSGITVGGATIESVSTGAGAPFSPPHDTSPTAMHKAGHDARNPALIKRFAVPVSALVCL